MAQAPNPEAGVDVVGSAFELEGIGRQVDVEEEIGWSLEVGDEELGHCKGAAVRHAVETVGARLLFLPPYSPAFNPIENAFSKLKALLRKAAARTVDQLWKAIAAAIDALTPSDCVGYFTAAGYEPD